MLYKMYNDELKILDDKNITDEKQIKNEFLSMLKLFFSGYESYSDPKKMVEDISLKLADSVVFSGGKASACGKTFYSKKELVSYFHDDLTRSLFDINPLWETYTKIDLLVDDMATFLSKRYVISTKETTNFNDAVKNTIKKYRINGQKITNKEDIIKCVLYVLREYFDNDNLAVFTKDKGSRNYVVSKTKSSILSEMAITTGLNGIDGVSEKQIRDSYAANFNYPYVLSEQPIENIKKSI